jgi:hypothetical protein
MWEDDRHWLPHMLDGDKFLAKFIFQDEKILCKQIEFGVEWGDEAGTSFQSVRRGWKSVALVSHCFRSAVFQVVDPLGPPTRQPPDRSAGKRSLPANATRKGASREERARW